MTIDVASRRKVLLRALTLLLLLLSIPACGRIGTNEPPAAQPTVILDPATPSLPAETPTTTTPVDEISYPLPTWSRGSVQAPVVVTIYGDYQSPPSSAMMSILDELLVRHPQLLKIEYRHFPLVTIHDKSLIAVLAAEASGQQGAFWPMHSWLYDNQSTWSGDSQEEFVERVIAAADSLGLDVTAFQASITDPQLQADVQETFNHAVSLGILSIPYVAINGEPFVLPATLSNLEAYTQLALLETRQEENYPPLNLEGEREWIARLLLDNGSEIVIQLYPDSAPLAVNSFLYLAEGGWFDNTGFYAVIPGVQVEGGDPSHTGLGDVGYYFETEIDPVRTFDESGMVGLIARGTDINGSAFFITLASRPELNGTRTIFGRVIAGLEQLQTLPARAPLEDLLQPLPLLITSIRIE